MDRATAAFFALRSEMRGMCLNMGVGEDDTDDVLQSCYLRIWNGLATYDSELGDLGPWMMGCLKHAIGDYVRSRDRHYGRIDRLAAMRSHFTHRNQHYYLSKRDEVEDKILAKVDREKLKNAVDLVVQFYVTPRQESLVRRHFMQQMRWDEVADEDGTTKNAIIQAWLYGRERLRQAIDGMIDSAAPMPRVANGRRAV